ncbi:MAG: hypothetical protein HN719_04700, partial [Alphaproteobacteria bacterium]|nr:hypothetical protein [Alphaproteobacteria bacterium]
MTIESPQGKDAHLDSFDTDTADGTDGAVELAQSVAQTNPSGEPIGQISALEGTAFITRTDGVKVEASDGTPIFQGDMVETNGNGAVGITFADESSFSLAENGSMVIDEMVYDPTSQSGTSAISVAEGVFTFVSGQIAKTDVEAMTISTPVAVIGIRGTSGGGQAGSEGTANTFSLFQDASGSTGEMVITTQGGAETLSAPNQTTQITSAFIPPTKPITLPPAAVAKFYAKAAKVAPTKIITQPANDAGPTGDAGPTEGGPTDQTAPNEQPGDTPAENAADAPADGPTEGPVEGPPIGPDGNGDLAIGPDGPGGPAPDGPVPGGPGGGPGGAFQDAEIAATNAFDKILAEGGSLEDAMAAGMNAATEAGLNTVLAANPEHFGSRESGNSVMNRMADEAFLGVTGRIDPMSAGTGAGTGAGDFSERMFFKNAIDSVTENEIFGIEGGLFGDFVEGPLIGGEGEFFEQFFDDPFQDFIGDVFFDPYQDFAGDGFFFEPPPLFYDENQVLTLTGDPNDDSPPPINTFDDFLAGTTGNDTLFGGEKNTRFTMVQGTSMGGTDSLNGGNGTDEIAAEGLSNIQMIWNNSTKTLSYANSTNSINGTVSTSSVEQLYADNGTESRVRLSLDGVGSGFGYIVSGTTGNDTINVSTGATLNYGSLGHTITASSVLGTILFGGAGDDTITGSEGGDIIYGGIGIDTINLSKNAGSEGDTVFGGAGNDTINVLGAAGGNNITGGAGSDTVSYANASFTSDAKANTYTISASSIGVNRTGASDTLNGIEVLNGSNIGDTYNFTGDLSGSFLTTINSGTGNDTFNLAAGANVTQTIAAGTGTDTLVFAGGGTVASISGITNITASSGTDTVSLGA